MDAVAPNMNLDMFERENFNVDAYVKRIVAESIYAQNISDIKEKLNKASTQTSEEIKQNVYKNYANFMETSKEIGHLEGKMSQLRQSLEEQRKLMNLFKNLNPNSSSLNNDSANSRSAKGQQKQANNNSSMSILMEQVEGCALIAQKAGRSLLYHSDLEALHIDDYSVSHKLHAYLLNDALLVTLPQRKRNKSNYNISSVSGLSSRMNDSLSLADTSIASSSPLSKSGTAKQYQYKFQALYELQEIKIMNIEDSKEVRNAFQLLKFPESLAFRCANAHLKKEWLENIQSAKKQLESHTDKSRSELASKAADLLLPSSLNNLSIHEAIEEENDQDDEAEDDDEEEKSAKGKQATKLKYDLSKLNEVSDFERNRILREFFSDFDVLLAQRDFEKAVEMLLKIKQTSRLEEVQELIYKQKESELINILRKDLISAKERANTKSVHKTGKRVVLSLIKLRIYDEAIDLFIDYHKHINFETLRKIKLEESNGVYMNNVLNLFFENLRNSFLSFKEAFASLINYCFSSYLNWCETEIEILIKKLQSQHYLGRHFHLTIENCELIFLKAKEFSEANNFEVKFMFETKLAAILENSIKEQQDILVDASFQRSKLELDDNPANNEQNRQAHLQKLLRDLEQNQLDKHFGEKDLSLINVCTSSALQFTRGSLNFIIDCLRVYYQDINAALVEAVLNLFKAELKIYSVQLSKYVNQAKSTKLNKKDLYNNVCFLEKTLAVIERLYFNRTSVHSKHFAKLNEKLVKFKKENF